MSKEFSEDKLIQASAAELLSRLTNNDIKVKTTINHI